MLPQIDETTLINEPKLNSHINIKFMQINTRIGHKLMTIVTEWNFTSEVLIHFISLFCSYDVL